MYTCQHVLCKIVKLFSETGFRAVLKVTPNSPHPIGIAVPQCPTVSHTDAEERPPGWVGLLRKNEEFARKLRMVVGAGFEPAKAKPADLQSEKKRGFTEETDAPNPKLTPNPPHPTDSSEEMPRIAVLFEVLFNATCLAVGIKN